jgi:hypothetical protein
MLSSEPAQDPTVSGVSAEDVEASKPGDSALLINRPWVDHMPRSERDMVTQLVFVDRDGQKMGALLRASRWRQIAELFRWEQRRGGLTVEFPQNNKRLPVSTRVWACKDAPKGFDLCLEVKLIGKGLRLYSNKKWSLDEPTSFSDFLTIDPDAVNASMDDEQVFEALSAE